MITIIGVKFRKSGKIYYFDPIGLPIEKGSHVIVETTRGVEYGSVILAPKEVTDDQVVQPLKPIIRMATEEDDQIALENEKEEKEAYTICLEKIHKHGLQMKLIDSEYTFDRNKLLFYFTADGRIDFRELVKDLASVFHTRIELRQIGVRDETKLIGGIAICGRPLCCHSYLTEFAPVSIKMAKEQNLSLNPSKISGVCGRLMCCLKNEQEAYEDLNRSLPHIGTIVTTSDGCRGEVQSVSVLRQLVKVIIETENDEREVREYHVKELNFKSKKNADGPVAAALPDESLDESELRELEDLEKEDIEETVEATETNPREKRGNNNSKKNRGNFVRNNNRGPENPQNRCSRRNQEYHRNNQNENIRNNQDKRERETQDKGNRERQGSRETHHKNRNGNRRFRRNNNPSESGDKE